MADKVSPMARLLASLLAGATIATAMVPDLAAAQDRGRAERPDDRREARQTRGGDADRSARRDSRVDRGSERRVERQRVVTPRAGQPRQYARPPLDGRTVRDRDDDRRDRQRYDQRVRYSDRDDRQVRWNPDWRRDNRYDWRGYRVRYTDVYRLPRYAAPYRSYGYQRFNIGWSLRSGFYQDRYWISDPWRYRLPAVHGPYRWVRYYDDVLLVDLRYGRVVDVIHDFFY